MSTSRAQAGQRPRRRSQSRTPKEYFQPLERGVYSLTERPPEVPTLKVYIGSKNNTPVRALVNTGSGYNTLTKSYIDENGLNMESDGDIPLWFFGRTTERVWLFNYYILQKFFIVETVPGAHPCQLGMPFIAVTNPSFCYRPDGSVDCTMDFDKIGIRAQVSRSLQQREEEERGGSWRNA